MCPYSAASFDVSAKRSRRERLAPETDGTARGRESAANSRRDWRGGGKTWDGEAEDCFHLGRSRSLHEQVSGDPQIHNTPIGLRETLADIRLPRFALISVRGFLL